MENITEILVEGLVENSLVNNEVEQSDNDLLCLVDNISNEYTEVYLYDEITKELIGTTHIVSSNTTSIKPSEDCIDGKVLVFDTDKWVIKDKTTVIAFKDTSDVINTITPRQARLILLKYNLLDDVENVIKLNREHSIYWEYSLEVNKNDSLLVEMTKALGITDTMLDTMFVEGSRL